MVDMDHINGLITAHKGFVLDGEDARALLVRSKGAGSLTVLDDLTINFRQASKIRGGEMIALVTLGENEDVSLQVAFPDAQAASAFLDEVALDEASVSMLPVTGSEIRYRREPLYLRVAL